MGVRRFALAAMLIAWTPAAAQDGPPAPPPPPASPVSPATAVRASMPLSGEPGVTLSFVTSGDRAMLLRSGRLTQAEPLDTVGQILSLLADPRAAPLWPAIMAWTGPDLSLFRDRLVEATRRGWDTGNGMRRPNHTAESMTAGPARALLQYAAALNAAGRSADAVALLERERPRFAPAVGGDGFDWVAASIRIAVFRRAGDDVAGAIGGLAADAARLGEENPFTVNLHVNRAAFLAEAGRFAEALALAARSLAVYEGGRGDGERVPGSGREFGWIRACALHGLGRVGEARDALRPVLRESEPAIDGWLLKRNASIRFRAFRCMGDTSAASALLADDLARSKLGSILLLQPAFRDHEANAAFLAAVCADARVRAAAAGRHRPLPLALEPALNGWRAP